MSPASSRWSCPSPCSARGGRFPWRLRPRLRTRQLRDLPQVDVPGAVLRDGQAQLTIRAPLKLVRFGGESGLAQSEAPTYSIDGEETFVLRRNAYDPPLAIEVAEPSPALSARTLARLDLRPDQCLLAADIVCTASGGSVFSVTFELPQAWDVTRVEAVADTSRMIDETTRTIGDRKRVKIDFFRAVTDREPKQFRVEASRSLPRSGESIDVPVIDFPGFAAQEVKTLVVHGSSIELTLSPADAFAAFDPAAILSVLADSPLRPNRSVGSETHMLANRWTGQSAKAADYPAARRSVAGGPRAGLRQRRRRPANLRANRGNDRSGVPRRSGARVSICRGSAILLEPVERSEAPSRRDAAVRSPTRGMEPARSR